MIALTALALSTPTHAELTAKQVVANEGSGQIRAITAGLEHGISWYNSLMEQANLQLYCQPRNLVFTVPYTLDILRRYLRHNSKAEDMPVGLAVILAFQNAFPCRERRNRPSELPGRFGPSGR
jgi:hypothetical protein